MHFADYGERFFDIMKKCERPCLILSLVDVFKPYRLQPCGSLCFRRVVFYHSIITLSFMPRNNFCSCRHTCISVASSKVLALNSLILYLGKIIFRTSDLTASSAKKNRAWF